MSRMRNAISRRAAVWLGFGAAGLSAMTGISAAGADRRSGGANAPVGGDVPMMPQGLIVVSSDRGPKETMDRVVAAVTARAINIVARVDHAAAAAKVGLRLGPTEVLIFGNPKAGTPLMQVSQTIGIDLPLKILVWQDGNGKTWLAYNDMHWLAARHAITGEENTLDAIDAVLAEIAREASQP